MGRHHPCSQSTSSMRCVASTKSMAIPYIPRQWPKRNLTIHYTPSQNAQLNRSSERSLNFISRTHLTSLSLLGRKHLKRVLCCAAGFGFTSSTGQLPSCLFQKVGKHGRKAR
ncbi:hypothetical protein BS17DRAFT_881267 [Gyrodon lividus]|nr:hypothetical protein BS17DRAFT_881267 [Gyrodon lividus]